jgi:hypothetical protein
MIEHTIAQYIETETSFVLGTDLFAYGLPEGTDEGIFVRISTEEYDFGALTTCVVTAFVTYTSYYETRENADTIREVLSSMKGLGDWSSGGTVRVTNLGENDRGACLFGVTSNIFYEGN